MFAALGDPIRLRLIAQLGEGQALSIAKLTRGAGMTRQGVAKHLRVLEDAGIVLSRKSGREARFVLRPWALREARGYLDHATTRWDAAVGRPRTLAEE